MQDIFKKLGTEYSAMQSKIVGQKAGLFKKLMAKQGAIVTTLPDAERRKWANAMPNIAKEWVDAQEAKGVPARQVMKTFMSVGARCRCKAAAFLGRRSLILSFL